MGARQATNPRGASRATSRRPARPRPEPSEPEVKIGPEWPADKVERRPVDQLLGHPRNARSHSAEQVAQIAKLIQRFGWTTPCVVNERGVILSGHGRVMAARSLGLATVPCVTVAGLSEADERALMIADNKVPSNAEWNNALLRDELLFLKASDDQDLLGLTGFAGDDLVAFLAGGGATPPGEFQRVGEDLDTEYCCPSCGYKWSGKADAGAAPPGEDED